MIQLSLMVVSDMVCPWCWIGKRRLDQGLALLAQREPELRFDVAFLPFMLNPDMPPAGMPRAEYRAAKFGSVARGEELDRNVSAAGAESGLEFRFERIERTANTIDAHRVSRFAAEAGRQAEVKEAIMHAYFHDGEDIGDRAVLACIAGAVGLDEAVIAARLATDEAVDQVRAEASGVARAGISGVPTFVLNRHILFSGAQPAEVIADSLARAARHPAILGEAA